MNSDLSSLTDEQHEAYDIITRRVEDGEQYTSLLGYAGTGKTYLSSILCTELSAKKVYACAPTHKAKYVLGEKMPLDAETVHSLLNLKLKKNYNTGEQYLIRNDENGLPTSGIVLLDEASMVGRNLWNYIEDTNLQWVFVGDPAQLPPVNEDPSPALDYDGYTLETIVRQEGTNPILEMATAIRNGEKPDYTTRMIDGQGVAVTSSSTSWFDSAAQRFDAEPDDSPPGARILAYHNRTVDYYNTMMRQALHGTTPEQFQRGDWLMLKQPFFDNDEGVLAVHNSEEVKVMQTQRQTLSVLGIEWPIWKLDVRRHDGQRTQIPVLDDEAERDFKAELDRHRKAAYEARKQKKPEKDHWRRFFTLLESFAKVSYCFAMTVHKSQGSTFDTVYVDHEDLVKCRSSIERQALKYVAVTRPSKRLALLV